MRNTYLRGLYNLASMDKRVVSVLADNGLIVYDDFRRDFPDRYYNFGIAEENMMAAAGGMASAGLIPYVYTIGAFLVYRAYEFLRDDICFSNQNVKIVAIGNGMTYSTLGPSHHTTEDIGLLRGLPNLTVFSPATRKEVEWIMEESYKINGPVYIRLSNNSEEYYEGDTKFEIGVPSIIKKGEDILILTTSSIIDVVINATEEIEKMGYSCTVASVHTLKPMNEEAIYALLSGYDRVIVVEEHNVISGLYGAIAEIATLYKVTADFLRIGLNDCFARGYGSIDDVRKMNGLDKVSIVSKIINYIGV